MTLANWTRAINAGACLPLAVLVIAACSPETGPGKTLTAVAIRPAQTSDDARPAASSTETPEATATAEPSPPGKCWGGAVSEDPLHCYMLQEAQRAGKITVSEVYEAPNNVLHIFIEEGLSLSQISELSYPPARGSLGREITETLHEKAREYLEGMGRLTYRTLDSVSSAYCDRFYARQFNECVLNPWRLPSVEEDWEAGRAGRLVPPITSHGQIYLYPGGEAFCGRLGVVDAAVAGGGGGR